MAKKKRAKRQSIRNLDLGFGGSEPLYGLEGLSSGSSYQDDRRMFGDVTTFGYIGGRYDRIAGASYYLALTAGVCD